MKNSTYAVTLISLMLIAVTASLCIYQYDFHKPAVAKAAALEKANQEKQADLQAQVNALRQQPQAATQTAPTTATTPTTQTAATSTSTFKPVTSTLDTDAMSVDPHSYMGYQCRTTYDTFAATTNCW